MVHPAFTVTRRILETLDEFPPLPDHLRYHGPRPRSWHPKITLYRLIALTTPVVLGTAKAIMTQKGTTFVPITLEWVTGTFLFLLLFSVNAYDSRPDVPSSLSWLIEHDCMNVVWRLVESFAISRPRYISQENIVAGSPDRAAYRILMCSVVTAFGVSKAVLGYYGQSTSVTWTEWAFAVPVTTFLYVLGLYEYNSLKRWPTFFVVDHSHKIYKTGGGMKTVLKYTVGPLICAAWILAWGRALWYTSQNMSWRVNPRPDISRLTFGMRLVLDGPFIMGTLLLQGGIILAIIGGLLGLFFALRLAFLEVLGKVRFHRQLLRAIRRLVMNTVALIAPSSSVNPFPDERIRVEHHPRRDIAESLAHNLASPTGRFVALTTLADGLYARFGHSDDATDLNEAISALDSALKCCTERDQQHSAVSFRIYAVLATRFDSTGDISDVGTGLHWLENGDINSTETSTSFVEVLEYTEELYERFTVSSNMTDLNIAVTLLRELIAELPQESEDYTDVIGRLGTALLGRFQQGGLQSDLDEAISLYRRALDFLLPDRSNSLNNLANALWTQFMQGGQQSDRALDDAISLYRQALELRPPPHHRRSHSLNNLASALSTRFDQEGQRGDLYEAISLHRQALKLLLPPHPLRSFSLNNLANALWIKFVQEGQQRDLDEAISMHRQALELRIPPHPLRSDSLNNLANQLVTRFKQGGQRRDLEEAISLHRQTLELQLSPHPHRPSSLDNLAVALSTRFEQEGRQSDLDEAILLHRESVELQLPPHPLRPNALNNLADALSTRFNHFGEESDLDEAISLHRQALELLLPPHPNRSESLNNLASALWARFEQGGQQSDLDEAISLHRQALELFTALHPNRSASLNNLANALSTRFEQEGQQSDLEEAISSFRTATQHRSQPPSLRLSIAKRWIGCADKNHHSSAIHAYEASLEALPRVAALSLDVESRQEALTSGSDGLARDASRCAILSGNIEKAVEFLEAGQSIFWSQHLSLRSPFDQLHKIAPELADRLRTIATELEVGSHRDISAEILDNQKRLLIDLEGSRLNRLNEEWDQSILEVRKLTGYEDFLRPSSLSSLRFAASEHPVIILVANDDGSHCLIMTSMILHHIPLPNLDTPMLQALAHNLQIAVSQLPVSRSFIDQTWERIITLLGEERGMRVKNDMGLGSSDEIFRAVLKILWDELVKPVIDFLDLTKSNNLPVLQWCLTGHFTFLPIHAAGCYDDERAIDCASDYFISSYTPTIGSLLVHDLVSSTPTFKMMAVIQSRELPSTKRELANIRKHVSSGALIELGIPGVPASVEAVASRLSDVAIVHFACHGKQDPLKPLESGLKLDDGLLRISRIMKENLPNGSLAFLCACETAMGDQNLPDEAMSLAASLIFSGFQRVIATMWEMSDEDGPTIADAFYEEIFRGPDGKGALEPDVTKSSLALHLAVKKLRSQGVPFLRWVPFIHIGK